MQDWTVHSHPETLTDPLADLSAQADDPQDAVVAKQYMSDQPTYIRTAKEWTRLYADPNKKDEKVESLVEMGFDRKAVIEALAAAGGDVNAATERLLGG